MILARYRHRLPADYDLGRIRSRIAARGPAWDLAPGLVFKAFTLEDRRQGARENAYSSLYLWQDAGAAADFLAGPGFAAVLEAFGRPRIDLWLPFDVRIGAAGHARSLAITDHTLPPEADLGAGRREEAARGRTLCGEPDVLAVLHGLDPAGWRLTRFVLRAGEPAAGAGEIVHLAAPGLAALRATSPTL
ncbi:DUF4865 family protein [Methylobacterium sp. J-076]|uniref:DUF4865 family protein n=1 Tax=Methylobacterium sp. J-076 TaxID=2836655 RepID=UPI001FB8AFCE|nr:DUF4865 family protein [Methylobacterium sp. J-076]MCJ2014859.1 DUF4865 family protein [Methylobacterium sp. J-076]